MEQRIYQQIFLGKRVIELVMMEFIGVPWFMIPRMAIITTIEYHCVDYLDMPVRSGDIPTIHHKLIFSISYDPLVSSWWWQLQRSGTNSSLFFWTAHLIFETLSTDPLNLLWILFIITKAAVEFKIFIHYYIINTIYIPCFALRFQGPGTRVYFSSEENHFTINKL